MYVHKLVRKCTYIIISQKTNLLFGGIIILEINIKRTTFYRLISTNFSICLSPNFVPSNLLAPMLSVRQFAFLILLLITSSAQAQLYSGTLTPTSSSFDSPEPNGSIPPVGYAKGTYYYQLFSIPVTTAGPYTFQGTTNFLNGSEGVLYQAPGPTADVAQTTGASVTNSLMAVGSSGANFSLTKTLAVGQYYFAVSTYAEKVTGSFTLTVIGPDPLPVQLVTFTAQAQPKGVYLAWTTASEVQNAFFLLERSSSTHQWEKVTRIPGYEISAQEKKYNWQDVSAPAGILYYRLSQTDLDGRVTYSPVVSVTNSLDNLNFFPNPVLNQATFTTSVATTLRVHDAVGRICQMIHLGSGSQQVVFDTLMPGVYWVIDDVTHQTLRLVKVGAR
jgi:hypothetical protein